MLSEGKYDNTPQIMVLGGTGFVGHHLAKALVAAGYNVTIPSRHTQQHADLVGLHGVSLINLHQATPSALAEQLAGHAALINLVGILNEPTHNGQGFERAHVEWTKMALGAAHTAGIKQYLHMSTLGAHARRGTSFYLRSKGKAEDWAHEFGAEHGIAVTSFRPSVIFGPGDSFLTRFAQLARWMPGVFPLACANARFAPVYVGDVVQQFIAVLEHPERSGQRLNLCGPQNYSLAELVDYAARLSGHPRQILPLPDWATRLQARVLEWAPGKPFTRDNYGSMQTPSICAPTCARQPTRLEKVAPLYL